MLIQKDVLFATFFYVYQFFCSKEEFDVVKTGNRSKSPLRCVMLPEVKRSATVSHLSWALFGSMFRTTSFL